MYSWSGRPIGNLVCVKFTPSLLPFLPPALPPSLPPSLLPCSHRYDLDNNPSGASFTRRVCPNKTPFGEFRDNVAHTCNEFGLRIWERYTPYVRTLIFMHAVIVYVMSSFV